MKMRMLIIGWFLLSMSLFAETVIIGSGRNMPLNVKVNHSDENSTELELNFSFFEKQSVIIEGKEFHHIFLEKEGLILEKGMPQVPFVGRSIIIPDNAKMNVSILESDYTDFQLSTAPSKGSLLRNVNPDDIPYTFADIYDQDQFYPKEIASLGDPYIMRDYRGITVGFTPFQYNAFTNTLRVYHHIVLKVFNTGIDTQNILSRSRNTVNKAFKSIYANHFLNFNSTQNRYVTIEEEGSILVITHPDFLSAVQPYVNWKKQKGFQTELVTTDTAGSNSTTLKTYIQNYYVQHPELAYIQLVGDAAQVPTLSYAGGGSDPSFVMLTGNDNYPDLLIGRFSAETVAHVETQVARTIWYERDIVATDGQWIKKATGIASNEGGGSQGDMGESDIAHQNLIRNDLLNFGYTSVDQAYAPSINTTTLSNYFNEGRGFINYVGHGAVTYWVTSGFSNTHVNALTNEGKLPFIVSVACVNGNFTSTTCFAEAWLRATNSGLPTGAMATYMSTINQPWNEPMRGQDIITDLMLAQNLYSIGGLFFNGSCGMLDAYNNNANSVNTMKTWITFGDASLIVRNNTPVVQTVNASDNLLMGINTYPVHTSIGLARVCLYNPATNSIIGSGYTNENGDINLQIEPQNTPENLTLTITAPNAVTYIKTVSVIPTQGAYTQNIALTSGWNLISFNTLPENLQLENITQALISNNHLVKVMNESGQAFEYVGILNQWINQIGSVSETEAYLIKVNENSTLSVNGTPVSLPLTIPLLSGWNLIAYPYNYSQNALPFLQPLISANHLVKIMNQRGQALEYLPTIGWIDNIQNFTPGEGYAINVNQNTEIVYPENNLYYEHPACRETPPVQQASCLQKNNDYNQYACITKDNRYFTKNWSGNGYKHHNFYILINDYLRNILKTGDEIAIFDRDHCVAVYYVNTDEYCISLIASMQEEDSEAENGYKAGHAFTFRIYANQTEYTNIPFEIIKGSSVFDPGASTVIQMNQLLTNEENVQVIVTDINSIYPNPFNPTTTIQYSLYKNDHVSLDIYNIKGQKVITLVSENQKAGDHQITWQGKNSNNKPVASGIYFCRLRTSDKLIVRKIIMIK